MQHTPRDRTHSKIAALTGALFFAMPVGALALPAVALTAHEALGTATGPGIDVMTSAQANGGDFFRNNIAGGDSSFFHTYGFSSGVTYFGARASGNGNFFVQTSATYTDSYFNNTGVAQLLTFNYTVDSGQTSISGTGTGYADLLLALKFNNVLVSGDHGRVGSGMCNTNVGGPGANAGSLANYLVCSGVNDAFASSGQYSASQLVAAGATLSIQYDIVAESAGSFSGTSTQYCSFGSGQANTGRLATPQVQFFDGPGASGCAFFNGLARSGDPAEFTPFAVSGLGFTTAAVVPEPAGWTLTGLALAGLAFARRGNRRRTAG